MQENIEQPETAAQLEPLVGRRIVSLSSCGVVENSQTQCEALLFALCSDGSVWMTNNRSLGDTWLPLTELPRGASLSDVERQTIRDALLFRGHSQIDGTHRGQIDDLLQRI